MARSSGRVLGLAAAALLFLSSQQGVQAALSENGTLTSWIGNLEANLRVTPVQGQIAARYYALLTNAVWRAIQANRANGNNTPRWDEGAVGAFAAHTLLTHWFPWTFYRNDLLIKQQIANVSLADVAGARALGEAIANKVTGTRTADGYARYKPGVWAPYNETGSIGRYQQTPGQTYFLYPQFGLSKPVLLSTDDTAAIVDKYVEVFQGYFKSDEYYADLNYTRTYGGVVSTARNDHDNVTPYFWAPGLGTASLNGLLIRGLYQVLPDDLSLYEQAKVLALFSIAAYDSSVATYRLKYVVNFWRPVTAINLPDGSDRYTPDPTWRNNLPLPPHPSYPSGHLGLTSPAVEIIKWAADTYLKSRPPITLVSENATLPSGTGSRTYNDYQEIIADASQSRVLAGAHYRRDNHDGALLGVDAAELVKRRFLASGPWAW